MKQRSIPWEISWVTFWRRVIFVIGKTYDSSLQKWQIAQQGKREIICEKLHLAMVRLIQVRLNNECILWRLQGQKCNKVRRPLQQEIITIELLKNWFIIDFFLLLITKFRRGLLLNQSLINKTNQYLLLICLESSASDHL